MNKKIIIASVFIFVLILVAGGFFWWEKREIRENLLIDYMIKETNEGKIVENKKAGLTVKVPKEWKSQIIGLRDVTAVLQSPDIEGERIRDITKPPFKKGCGIEINIAYEKTNFNELIKTVKEVNTESGIEYSELEMTTINNRQALKNIFDSSITGPSMTVDFIQDAKVFFFTLRAASEDKEKCIQEFNKFLETVSIK